MLIAAAVLGRIAGSAVLYTIAKEKEGFSAAGGFASNGYRRSIRREVRILFIRRA